MKERTEMEQNIKKKKKVFEIVFKKIFKME